MPTPSWAFRLHWADPGSAPARDLTLAQRRLLIERVAASGVLENLRLAVQVAACPPAPAAAAAAAGSPHPGALDCTQWLIHGHSECATGSDDAGDGCSSCISSSSIVTHAGSSGSSSSRAGGDTNSTCGCSYLAKKLCVRAAARAGNVTTCDWLLQQEVWWRRRLLCKALQEAAAHEQQAVWDWAMAQLLRDDGGGGGGDCISASSRGGTPVAAAALAARRQALVIAARLRPLESLRRQVEALLGLPQPPQPQPAVPPAAPDTAAHGPDTGASAGAHHQSWTPQSGSHPTGPAGALRLPELLGPCLSARLLAAAASAAGPDFAAKLEYLEALGLTPCPQVLRAMEDTPDASSRLLWLRGRGGDYPQPPGDADVVRAAVRSGDVALLRRLLPPPPLSWVVSDAWRLLSGVWDADVAACSDARALEVLLLLHGAGWRCRSVRRVAAEAARRRWCDVVEWLLTSPEVQRPAAMLSDTQLLRAGTESENPSMLPLLRRLGCEWDAGAYTAAAAAGNGPALRWLAEQGCPMPACGAPYVRAGLNGDLLTTICLLELGVPGGEAARDHAHAQA
ncbi:hypothetical protein HXX76_004274 [Chlamydomonas incerta]|uniref:Ankyrin repeat domain-containing protein n=1 Tax=Chlamydomonas incerta TaxID=51695 RepID=A0A835T9W7_CHLIN|nr:hypothetical protein HXX76_004274 [Chlamydomonas incerta]|eukprot:KAG2440161.1 hypothetical protein HXX76_004274 [Chlamydomonas incerta]